MTKSLKPFLITLLLLMLFVSTTLAQEVQRNSPIQVQCGTIVEEAQFTANYEENSYAINLSAGDSLNVSVVPLGERLFTSLFITGPTNLGIAVSNARLGQNYIEIFGIDQQPSVEVNKVPANGTYTIRLINFSARSYEFEDDAFSTYSSAPGGIGVYTLYVGCTLRDSTVINPGDIPQEVQPTQASGGNPVTTTFTGNGFPGLAPVDFANVARIPLIANTPMTGAITPTGGEILGYTLDANAGDKLDLAFTRLSGNLNLGLVVLSAENQVVFQASLVTSESMSTRLTLPTAGQYTIGVFRIDLLPPTAPEATAFQVQGTLNP